MVGLILMLLFLEATHWDGATRSWNRDMSSE